MFAKILLTSYLFFILGLGQWAAASELVVLAVHLRQNGEVSVLLDVPVDIQFNADQVRLVEDNEVTVPADTVTPFKDSDWNRALVLCIDKSGSVSDKELEEVKNALRSVLKERSFRFKDQIALVTFENEPRFIPWASSDEIALRINEIQNMKGRNTALYDALFDSLAHLSGNNSVPPPVLKQILLVSDGNNQGGVRKSIVDVKDRAVRVEIAIDAVLLHPQSEDEEAIRFLTEQTGGKIVTSSGAGNIASAIEQLFDKIENSTVVHFNREATVPGQTTAQVGIQVSQAGKQLASDNISAAIPVTSSQVNNEENVPKPTTVKKSPPTTVDGKSDSPPLSLLTKLKKNLRAYWPELLAGILLITILIIVALVLLGKNTNNNNKESAEIFINPPPPPEEQKSVTFTPDSHQESVAPGPPPPRRQTLVGGVCYPAPTANKPTAVLTCLAGSLAGQQFPIHQEMMEIGANKNNDICITGDEYISRRHASLCFENGALVLYDRGSSNGTFVEDTRVPDTGRTLKPGEKIRVGFNVFEVGAPPD